MYEFQNVHQLLAWYVFNNPARQKSLNIMEKDVSCKSDDKSVLWALLTKLIWRVLSESSRHEKKAFVMYYGLNNRFGIHDIAGKIGKSKSTTRRYLNKIVDEIERISINMRILPPNEEKPIGE